MLERATYTLSGEKSEMGGVQDALGPRHIYQTLRERRVRMKVIIEKCTDFSFGLRIFKSFIVIDIPYWEITLMGNKTWKETE